MRIITPYFPVPVDYVEQPVISKQQVLPVNFGVNGWEWFMVAAFSIQATLGAVPATVALTLTSSAGGLYVFPASVSNLSASPAFVTWAIGGSLASYNSTQCAGTLPCIQFLGDAALSVQEFGGALGDQFGAGVLMLVGKLAGTPPLTENWKPNPV